MNIENIKKIKNLNDYKRVPICKEIYSDFITPIEAMRILKSKSVNAFLLESVEDRKVWGRYTFLCYEPILEINANKWNINIKDKNGLKTIKGNPKDIIRKILKEYKTPKIDDMPTFTGGLAGYFSYDYIRYNEKKLDFEEYDNKFYDLNLSLFNDVIIFDNFKQKIILISGIEISKLDSQYDKALEKLDSIEKLLKTESKKYKNSFEKFSFKSEAKHFFSKEKYCDMVEKAKKYIYEGDIFQVVLSNPIYAKAEGNLFDVYRVLRTINPSPYMFYFSMGDIEIAGSSPETLVKLENDKLHTYPLAGSRPRGKTLEEDLQFEKELLTDKKELAEHNMLVDLGRNDIGKISKIGSVNVEKYKFVEKYSHIMHIGSTVSGIIRDDKDALDVLDSILPAGTLSGAPKIRACEIINELEGICRGIYGGAIGYIDFSGNMDTCIGIRLIYKKEDEICIRAGAGIVYDSVGEKEYIECINKAAAVLKAAQMAEMEL
ncbi:anthranilate synthase component I family protein [Brachyspira aalborgi]|uniref:anthranilate synthase component I family protein n=1 Tax=Brachyspira aalborgi TaxID=29522 RepID=UPI00266D3339|nr:anthranilate synthase component I family protein [Brachyspira aalborgi]